MASMRMHGRRRETPPSTKRYSGPPRVSVEGEGWGEGEGETETATEGEDEGEKVEVECGG